MNRPRSAGYNLVALVVAVTILGILLATALPMISHSMQREKEAELIFRGLQYAEAIRVFQARQGRNPTSLDELLEVEPRSIRQLWTDPVMDSAEWGLVFADSPQQGVDVAGDNRGAARTRRNDPQGRNRRRSDSSFGTPQRGETVTQAQIQGVFSQSEDESIRVFFGQETYSEWKFTPNLLNISVGPGGIATPRIRLSMMGKAMPDWLAGSELGGALPGALGSQGGGNPFGRDATEPIGLADDLFGTDDDAFGGFDQDSGFGGQPDNPFGGGFGDRPSAGGQDNPFGGNQGDRGSGPRGSQPSNDPFGTDPTLSDPFGVPEGNPFGDPSGDDDGN